MKITILGAAGGIGESLALVLKLHLPENSTLSLYDIDLSTPGIAKDLSHIPSSVKIHGYTEEGLKESLIGADIVIIAAGVARKPGMDRSDLFNVNANIIKKLVQECADIVPNASIGIITNPLNILIPIAAQVLKKAGVYNKNKLFGITTLDTIRTKSFISEMKGVSSDTIHASIIGGHCADTIIPLLSQLDSLSFTEEEIVSLTDRIKTAGTEVVNAKAGAGSATVSMAYAASLFCLDLVKAMQGEKGIVHNAYVDISDSADLFFAQPLLLGKNGIEEILTYGKLSDFEQKLKEKAILKLQGNIKKGIDFVNNN